MKVTEDKVPVVWLRTVNVPYGKETERVECLLVISDGFWATVELADGERRAVEMTELHVKKP
jgi:hypothetical protein